MIGPMGTAIASSFIDSSMVSIVGLMGVAMMGFMVPMAIAHMKIGGHMVIGFSMIWFWVIGFRMIGFWVIGFSMIGFSMIGFWVIGFSMIGLRVIGLSMIGFRMIWFRVIRIMVGNTMVMTTCEVTVFVF